MNPTSTSQFQAKADEAQTQLASMIVLQRMGWCVEEFE
jgi:hypothetical protein